MTRVGFMLADSGASWLGGVNYVRNLFAALDAESVGVQPVVLAGTDTNTRPPVGGVEVLDARALASGGARVVRAVTRRALGRDLLLERFLRHNGIDVLSHSGVFARRSRVAVVNWIPDLQHRRLPGFFEEQERRERDRSYDLVCRRSSLIVASSACARRDLEEYFPVAIGKVRVLRFVDLSCDAPPIEPALLARRYGFEGRYLLVPNQFWVHKNHAIVLRALDVLKRRGRDVRVLATGLTADYRRPGHFGELMRMRTEAGIDAQFTPLGVVPRDDLVNLARGAVALINPSLFEGWSTSVEEARSLGKRIILSDIDVHREQAPPRAAFFDPQDAEALADRMWDAWQAYDREEEARSAARAALEIPARRRVFAETYAAIVREALAMSRAPDRSSR